MALRIIISQEEREALPENIQAEYKPLAGQDGKFVIDGIAVDGWAIEDVVGLRRTVETTRAERDKLKEKVKTFDGVDAAEYARLKAKKAEIEGWDPTNDDAFKTRLEEQNATWQTKYDADVAVEKKAKEDAHKRYVQFRKQAEATAAVSKYVLPKSGKALLPHVLGQLEVYPSEDGDTDQVWVRGSDGRPRITQKAGEQGNMTPEELVLSMKEDEAFAPLFPGTGATGGGATGGGSGKGTVVVDPSLNPVERLKAARKAETQAR